MELIANAFRWLIYTLSIMVYQLIIWLYDIFMRLCNSRILDSEVLKLISNRIGVILGIIMLFIVMFSVIQMVLEPDKLTDKEKGIGNIVKKVLLVIVMLAMSSAAFSALYGLQKNIINSNIIAKFILPYEVETDNFGGLLAAELFTAFYHFDENLKTDGISPEEQNCINSIDLMKEEISELGDFSSGDICRNEKSGDQYMIDFNWLLLPIVGVGAVYFIFSYCLSIGMRTFQLVFLEIISPMAIVSYLSPKKETMLQKWWKIYFSTYIDVFLRIAIINLVVFLIGVIFDANLSGTFWASVGGQTGFFTDTLITVFIIMSLLMFAKKAPDLIKELFPASASKLGLGITPPKKIFESMAGGNLVRGGLGMAAGLALGGAGNAIRAFNAKDENGEPLGNRWKRTIGGLFGGAFAGAKAGATSKSFFKSFGEANKAAAAQSDRVTEWYANGGTSAWQRWKFGMQQRMNLQTEAQRLDLQKSKLEAENAIYKSYDSYFDAAEKRAESQILKGKFASNEHAKSALHAKNMAEIYKNQSASIKLSDFELDDGTFDQTAYDSALQELAKKATEQEAIYQSELKEAKADWITKALSDPTHDHGVTLQSLQQAAAVVTANQKGVFKGKNGDDLRNYDAFDELNTAAKTQQTANNNELERNKATGEQTRNNAKYYSNKGGSK